MSTEWNLDPTSYQSVTAYGVTIQDGALDIQDCSEELRLAVVAHQIAASGVPAFFLPNGASYLTKLKPHKPVVVVFDFENQFTSDSLLCVDVVEWIWEPQQYFNQIMEDCQKAVNLAMYYKTKTMDRIYFRSFLFFGARDPTHKAYLLQSIPCVIDGSLRFRTVSQAGLEWSAGSVGTPPLLSVIMIPPNDHPFLVKSIQAKQMTVVGVDFREHVIDISKSNFILVLKPNSFLLRYLRREVSRPGETRMRFSDFNPLPPISVSDDVIDKFFSPKTISNSERERLKAVSDWESIFSEEKPTLDQVISEQVTESWLATEITKLLCDFIEIPMEQFSLNVEIDHYMSFYDFECPIRQTLLPWYTGELVKTSRVDYLPLSIPKVLVNNGGYCFYVDANCVIENWERDRYAPISGAKSMNVIVFAEKTLTEDACRLFIGELTHFYSALGFGRISLLRTRDGVEITHVVDMRETIHKFLEAHPLTEFQRFPLYFIVLSNTYIANEFPRNCFLSCFDLAKVESPSSEFLKRTCFEMYTRIRSYESPILSIPQGSTEIGAMTEIESLFFGFRYAPPFLLQRAQEKVLGLHIVWDIENSLSVWTDDIGSSLHEYKTQDAEWILNTLSDAARILKTITIEATLCILGEGITDLDYDRLECLGEIVICSIQPRPEVQLSSEFCVEGDVILKCPWECQSKVDKVYRTPLCSCVVVSSKHLGYSLSLYRCPSTESDPEQLLYRVAQDLSNLSWLSAKPEREQRDVIYPPHLAVILKKTRREVNYFDRFEFLPE